MSGDEGELWGGTEGEIYKEVGVCSSQFNRATVALLLPFALCPVQDTSYLRYILFGVWFDPNLELSSGLIDGVVMETND